jgi:deoxyribose-phosphate aldolase
MLQHSPGVDSVSIEERVQRFKSRSLKKHSKEQALLLALSMMDLTTLEGSDSEGKVRRLCAKATHLLEAIPDLPAVAAVCVYPTLVAVAHKALKGTGVRVASVATGFPSGLTPLKLRLKEIKMAVNDGADEIDMVISRGKFLSGEYAFVADEIAASKDACGNAHLKVIIETGELGTYDNIRRASDLAMYAGADFIKTSTGKVQPAATMGSTLVMLEAIRDFYLRTGRRVGMKPAGGISDAKSALQYLVMLGETLGKDWLTPELFRFGASKLANDVLMQICKQKTGRYQAADYFSLI